MPDRIIRDELAGSDKWLGLKRNTHRLAFVICILSADSLGNFEATEPALWRRWRDPLGLTERAQVAEILTSLADSGLVRLYEVDGKRYGHIPKWRQRLRYLKGKHPRPPANIECNEIKAALGPRSDRSQSVDIPQSVNSRRREVKRSEELLKPRARATPVDNLTTTIEQAKVKPGLEKIKINPEPKKAHMTRDEQLAYVSDRIRAAD